MRRVFLWAARNSWLKERLPRLRFMRRAVRRFMPGETLADALAAALPLQAAGIGTLYTRLGENLEHLAEADEVAAHYLDAIDQIVAAGHHRRGLGQADPARARPRRRRCASAHLVRIAAHAAAAGSYLWIDMEGSAYVDATIDLYERLRATQPRTGICLQAYLRRTAADIERLRPLDPAIRLVKGAYDEKESIAYRNRRNVDANFVGLAVSVPARRARPADPARPRDPRRRRSSSRSPSRSRRPGSVATGSRSRCCTASGPDQQFRLAKAGYRVQTLIAYGEHWYPWYMRRLAERPANVSFVMRQMLPWSEVGTMRIAARMGTIGTESAFEVSARARALEAQGRSIVHLQIGEPDFDTPANVRAAAKAALDAGATHYPPYRRASRPCARRSPPTRPRARASRSSRRRSSSRSVARGSCSTPSSAWSIRATRSSCPTRATRSTSR